MKRPPRSSLEASLDEVLRKLYPQHRIVHDLPIKVGGAVVLYVDRVIPSLGLAFEVDGTQHQIFSRFYHRDAEGFANHKKRDAAKQAWLNSEGYTLIRIAHDDPITAPAIRARIIEALNG